EGDSDRHRIQACRASDGGGGARSARRLTAVSDQLQEADADRVYQQHSLGHSADDSLSDRAAPPAGYGFGDLGRHPDGIRKGKGHRSRLSHRSLVQQSDRRKNHRHTRTAGLNQRNAVPVATTARTSISKSSRRLRWLVMATRIANLRLSIVCEGIASPLS